MITDFNLRRLGMAILSLICFYGFSQNKETEIKSRKADVNGQVNFISFTAKQSYLKENSKDIFQKELGISRESEFKKIRSEFDNLGYEHDKYQLYHNGIKVEFATYTLHSKKGKVESMSGEFYAMDDVMKVVNISEKYAFTKAKKSTGAKKFIWEMSADKTVPKGEIVYLPVRNVESGKMEVRLAYKFVIHAVEPLSKANIYIDATNGDVLLTNAIIKHVGEHAHEVRKFGKKTDGKSVLENLFVTGSAFTKYSGTRTIETTYQNNRYILLDQGRKIQTYKVLNYNMGNSVDYSDIDNNWTQQEFDNSAKDFAGLDCHWGTMKTYDYWKNKHNRNSYDNSGSKINSYVNAFNDFNAYWDDNLLRMIYGTGGTGSNPLTSIDIVAHEIGHGICQFTADLVYSYESGAMNEGFSDIWGACVKYYADPSKQYWESGNELSGSLYGFRSLLNPKRKNQPDTYKGINWYYGSGDFGGVHTNSGVLNHWFYILTAGKTGTNDKGDSYNVIGIGIDKAAMIAYRLESVYLSSNSQYIDARTYGIQSATDLFGAGSTEVIATTNAFYAVGIGAAYQGNIDTQVPTEPVNLQASNITINSTQLVWGASTDNVGVVNYNIYRGSSLIATSTNTSYTVTGLTAATTYTFLVKAVDAAGNISAGSNVVHVTTLNNTIDNQSPTAPSNLTASNTTTTSTQLSWGASTDNVGVVTYNIWKNNVFLTSVTGTTVLITGLIPNANYSFYVAAVDAAGNISNASNILNVTTLSNANTYCIARGMNSNYEFIDRLGFNNGYYPSSSDGGYANRMNVVFNLPYGHNRIFISAGFSSYSYTEYWRAWIDFNQNGQFENSEMIINGYTVDSGLYGVNFNVPSTAISGPTRVRVAMKYGGYPSSCETFAFGEVEDYTVNIGANTITSYVANAIDSDVKELNSGYNEELQIYPIPAVDLLNINRDFDKDIEYKITNHLGRLILKGTLRIGEKGIYLDKISAGMYFLEINDGQRILTTKFIKKD